MALLESIKLTQPDLLILSEFKLASSDHYFLFKVVPFNNPLEYLSKSLFYSLGSSAFFPILNIYATFVISSFGTSLLFMIPQLSTEQFCDLSGRSVGFLGSNLPIPFLLIHLE